MKYIVIEDTSFLPLGEIVVDSVFDSLDEAEQYLSTQFCWLEWEHVMHRVLYIVKLDEEVFSDKPEYPERCSRCDNLSIEGDETWYCREYNRYCKDIVEVCNNILGVVNK